MIGLVVSLAENQRHMHTERQKQISDTERNSHRHTHTHTHSERESDGEAHTETETENKASLCIQFPRFIPVVWQWIAGKESQAIVYVLDILLVCKIK